MFNIVSSFLGYFLSLLSHVNTIISNSILYLIELLEFFFYFFYNIINNYTSLLYSFFRLIINFFINILINLFTYLSFFTTNLKNIISNYTFIINRYTIVRNNRPLIDALIKFSHSFLDLLKIFILNISIVLNRGNIPALKKSINKLIRGLQQEILILEDRNNAYANLNNKNIYVRELIRENGNVVGLRLGVRNSIPRNIVYANNVREQLFRIILHKFNVDKDIKLSNKLIKLRCLEDILVALDPSYICVENNMRIQ